MEHRDGAAQHYYYDYYVCVMPRVGACVLVFRGVVLVCLFRLGVVINMVVVVVVVVILSPTSFLLCVVCGCFVRFAFGLCCVYVLCYEMRKPLEPARIIYF